MTELDKFAEAVPSIQVLDEFLDWCDQQKIELATWTNRNRMLPLTEGRTQMFARYFKIDTVKLENERRALLVSPSNNLDPEKKPR